MKTNKIMEDKEKEAIKKNDLKVMEMVGKELKPKYPNGSCVVFSSDRKQGEKIITMSCDWYNKVGTDPKKNIVSKPPEWQNIPYEEAMKICDMFSKHYCLNLVYV